MIGHIPGLIAIATAAILKFGSWRSRMYYIELTNNEARAVYVNMAMVVAVTSFDSYEKPYCKSRLVTPHRESMFVRETPVEVMERLNNVLRGEGRS
jgi:hypothetical protein